MGKRFYSLIFMIMLVIRLKAQTVADKVDMADQFRADGKIYVVIAVLSTILFGIGYYLWTIDRKISRLERERKERKDKR
jgi:hypothetical protein